MPTYVYKREDGTTFEIDQRMSADALKECPTTGQKVSRVITGGTGFIFKGTGFYVTDYVRKDGGKESNDGAESEGGTADSKTSSASDSTSDKSESKASSSKSDASSPSSGNSGNDSSSS